MGLTAGHFSFFFFYSGILIRSIFGFLPFNIIFASVEAMKISFTQVIAVFNVSAAVQLSIILNFDWVQKFEDKVIIQISTAFIFLHLAFPAVDYVLVRKEEEKLLKKTKTLSHKTIFFVHMVQMFIYRKYSLGLTFMKQNTTVGSLILYFIYSGTRRSLIYQFLISDVLGHNSNVNQRVFC